MLTREITLPVDPERVWEALAEPSEWIGARVEWELVPGGRARFLDDPEGERAGEVDDVQPGRRLSFRWWPEDDRADESEVTYELEPAEEGTRLVVTERRVGREAPADGVQASAHWTAWDGRLVGLWGRNRGCRALAPTARPEIAPTAGPAMGPTARPGMAAAARPRVAATSASVRLRA